MSAIPYNSFKQDFTFVKSLGKGNCAVVNLVYHTLDKKSYAHKQISAHSSEEVSQAINEIEVVLGLDQEKVTKIYYYYLHHHKHGNYELGLLMELCEGNLTQAIKDRKKKGCYFKREEINAFLNAMIPLFVRLQKRGYLHRDIKPDNILLARGRKLDFRLADFGFALKINCYSSRNVAGTMEYVSPKLKIKFQNQKVSVPGHTIKDDVYSLGKTLSQMMLLQVGLEFNDKKLIECRNRYGDTYGTLLEMMLEVREQKRSDFIAIQDYLVHNEIIGSFTCSRASSNSDRVSSKTKIKGNSLVKIQTNPGGQIKHLNFNVSTASTLTAASKNRDANTKQKGVKVESKNESYESEDPIVKEEIIKKIQMNEQCEKKITSLNSMHQKIIKTKEEITCIANTDHLVFLGLEEKLGIVILATNKQIRLPHLGGSFQQICHLKVSQNQEILYIATLSSKIYVISILEVNDLVLKNDKSLSLMNMVEVSFNCLTSREIAMDSPVSTMDLLSDNSYEQTWAVVGHCTGGISVISNGKVQKSVSFVTDPLTKIQLKENIIYISTAGGQFKRQNASSLGITSKEVVLAQNRNHGLSSLLKLNVYKVQSAIITFEIISECKFNKNIAENNNQHYLAVLACYDGFIHIVSKEMKCQRIVRVSPTNMLASVLFPSEQQNDGFQGLFVGENGSLYQEKGVKLRELGAKRITSVCRTASSIFCGGFDKSLVLLTSKDHTIDLD